MTLNKLQYRNKPIHLEVIEVTQSNVDEVARWCGGSVEKIHNTLSNQMESTGLLAVPSIYGSISAELGSFVARDRETGRFSVMKREHLDSEYERVGVRSEGFVNNGFPRLGGN
jgi:hypothetical protein